MSFQNCKIVGCDVDADAYHAENSDRGVLGFMMSPSALKLFAQCPRRWVRGYREPESPYKDWGNMVDTMLLTPADFKSRYTVTPSTYPAPKDHRLVKKKLLAEGDMIEWNNRTNYCKEWKEDQEERGFKVIDRDELTAVQTAADRLMDDEQIAEFVTDSKRQVLVMGEWKDEPSGLTVPVRCLIDLAPGRDSIYSQCLGDLKTSGTAAVLPFTRQAYRFGYHIQGAFDLDLFNAATGEQRDTWCLIVQESRAPFEVGKRMLSQEFLHIGRSSYRAALGRYCQCLKTDTWPGYDDTDEACDGWSLVVAESWMGSEDLFAPKMEIQEEEAPEVSEIPS